MVRTTEQCSFAQLRDFIVISLQVQNIFLHYLPSFLDRVYIYIYMGVCVCVCVCMCVCVCVCVCVCINLIRSCKHCCPYSVM
jgi:hypothetical protein